MPSEAPNNLKLWESVKATDKKAIKPITGKSYKGSSPNPYWLIWKATETFGPIGIGWGFTILDERIEPGIAGADSISIARVRVWYKWEGSTGEVEHVGGTTFSGKRRSGDLFSDEDGPKKSVTDAITKALSLIGFAGDIFGERWDDNKYTEEPRTDYAPPAERAPAEEFKPATEPQIKMLQAEMVRAAVGWKRLLTHYKLETKEQISVSTAEAMIADVKALPTPEATKAPAEATA